MSYYVMLGYVRIFYFNLLCERIVCEIISDFIVFFGRFEWMVEKNEIKIV